MEKINKKKLKEILKKSLGKKDFFLTKKPFL